jgi:hypothetical protein
VSWHTPDDAEIEFALDIFRDLVEPVVGVLEELIRPGNVHPFSECTSDNNELGKENCAMRYGEMTFAG